MMAPMGIYFAVPAFIYTLYNSLFFFNLIHFDPVSYRVLINMRILWSGILFQIFFSKRLGWQKWFALFLLMLGCAVNQLTPDFQLTTNLYYIGTIVFQSLTSSFGGVYSEVLLKRVRYYAFAPALLRPRPPPSLRHPLRPSILLSLHR